MRTNPQLFEVRSGGLVGTSDVMACLFFLSASRSLSPSRVRLWAGLGSELELEIYQA